VLSSGAAPFTFRPLASGYGAGARDPAGRANVLRIVLAETDDVPGDVETVELLAADVDDMAGEYLAAAAESLREAGALDVTLLQTVMKKGRPAVRIEVLCRPGDVDRLENVLLTESSTIGVRRSTVSRRVLAREQRTVEVFGRPVTIKSVSLPGGGQRAKAEYEDVRRVARESGRTTAEVLDAIAKRT